MTARAISRYPVRIEDRREGAVIEQTSVVLIVDADRVLRRLPRAALRGGVYPLRPAATATEAGVPLARLDAVLRDPDLPDCGGWSPLDRVTRPGVRPAWR